MEAEHDLSSAAAEDSAPAEAHHEDVDQGAEQDAREPRRLDRRFGASVLWRLLGWLTREKRDGWDRRARESTPPKSEESY
jgi:hypothetical protein